MANWCNNYLNVKGNEDDFNKYEEWVLQYKNIDNPDEVLSFDFCKDSVFDYYFERDEKAWKMFFTSRWSPHIKLVEAFADAFPEAKGKLHASECGMEFRFKGVFDKNDWKYAYEIETTCYNWFPTKVIDLINDKVLYQMDKDYQEKLEQEVFSDDEESATLPEAIRYHKEQRECREKNKDIFKEPEDVIIDPTPEPTIFISSPTAPMSEVQQVALDGLSRMGSKTKDEMIEEVLPGHEGDLTYEEATKVVVYWVKKLRKEREEQKNG
jgi:hypothetical protein